MHDEAINGDKDDRGPVNEREMNTSQKVKMAGICGCQ